MFASEINQSLCVSVLGGINTVDVENPHGVYVSACDGCGTCCSNPCTCQPDQDCC